MHIAKSLENLVRCIGKLGAHHSWHKIFYDKASHNENAGKLKGSGPNSLVTANWMRSLCLFLAMASFRAHAIVEGCGEGYTVVEGIAPKPLSPLACNDSIVVGQCIAPKERAIDFCSSSTSCCGVSSTDHMGWRYPGMWWAGAGPIDTNSSGWTTCKKHTGLHADAQAIIAENHLAVDTCEEGYSIMDGLVAATLSCTASVVPDYCIAERNDAFRFCNQSAACFGVSQYEGMSGWRFEGMYVAGARPIRPVNGWKTCQKVDHFSRTFPTPLHSNVLRRPPPSRSNLVQQLYKGQEPFALFTNPRRLAWKGDLMWSNIGKHPEDVKHLIDLADASFIVEVGSYVGTSTKRWAQGLMQKGVANDNRVVLTIDTWLGDLASWTTRVDANSRSVPDDVLVDGRPHLYDQFMLNMILNNMTNTVVPFPVTSTVGARWLAYENYEADLL